MRRNKHSQDNQTYSGYFFLFPFIFTILKVYKSHLLLRQSYSKLKNDNYFFLFSNLKKTLFWFSCLLIMSYSLVSKVMNVKQSRFF